MFQRYDERARQTVFFARDEASQFGSPQIETEHILLALLQVDKELVRKLHLDPDALRAQIESVTIRNRPSGAVDLPLAPESKRVLAFADEEAGRMHDKRIGSEHIFIALLREEKSFAAQLLGGAGVTLESARTRISNLSGHHPGPMDAT